MPKEMRQRIIDYPPPKATPPAMLPRQPVTPADPDPEDEPEEIPLPETEPVVSMQPGDAVLWFLNKPAADAPPSGRGVTLKTTAGGAASFSYVTLPSSWANYITSFAGATTWNAAGDAIIEQQTVYMIFDQFTGFAAGNYKLSFTATGAVDKAFLLRNIDPADPGTFYAGVTRTPPWSVSYADNTPDGKTSYFPATATLTAGRSKAAFAIWQMDGGVQAPAAYWSTPGLAQLTYWYSNPIDQPFFRRTIVASLGTIPGTFASIEIPAPWENGWGGAF